MLHKRAISASWSHDWRMGEDMLKTGVERSLFYCCNADNAWVWLHIPCLLISKSMSFVSAGLGASLATWLRYKQSNMPPSQRSVMRPGGAGVLSCWIEWLTHWLDNQIYKQVKIWFQKCYKKHISIGHYTHGLLFVVWQSHSMLFDRVSQYVDAFIEKWGFNLMCSVITRVVYKSLGVDNINDHHCTPNTCKHRCRGTHSQKVI